MHLFHFLLDGEKDEPTIQFQSQLCVSSSRKQGMLLLLLLLTPFGLHWTDLYTGALSNAATTVSAMFTMENLVIMPTFFGPYEHFLCPIVSVMVATVPVAVQPSNKICTNFLLLCLCFMCNYEHSEHHILCEPLMVIVFFSLVSVYVVWVGQLNNIKIHIHPRKYRANAKHATAPWPQTVRPNTARKKNKQTLEPTYSPVNPGLFHVRAAASLPYEHVDYAFVHRFGRTAAQLTLALRL